MAESARWVITQMKERKKERRGLEVETHEKRVSLRQTLRLSFAFPMNPISLSAITAKVEEREKENDQIEMKGKGGCKLGLGFHCL